MSKLEEVRDKIIEAVPEIVEIKFGCRIILKPRFKDEDESEWVFIGPKSFSQEQTISVWNEINGLGVYSFIEGHHEIIGRPVRLADVLIAAKEKDVAMTVNQRGRLQLEEMVKYHAQKDLRPSSTFPVHWVGCDWNLHKDSLDDQEPDTIDFLHQILCKE